MVDTRGVLASRTPVKPAIVILKESGAFHTRVIEESIFRMQIMTEANSALAKTIPEDADSWILRRLARRASSE